MKRGLIPDLAVLCIALLVFFEQARACSCAYASTCGQFRSATTIFVGTCLGPATPDTVLPWSQGRQFRFRIKDVYKGAPPAMVVVTTGWGGGDCGYSFEKGSEYLVYAFGENNYTDICTRTGPVSEAALDLFFLDHIAGRRSSAVFGRLEAIHQFSMGGDPVPALTVLLVGMGDTLRTVTDENGIYSFIGVQEGEYVVLPLVPPKYVLLTFFYDTVRVIEGGCAERNFNIVGNGRLNGKVIDRDGQPMKIAVDLVPLEQQEFSVYETDFTDSDGKYAFKNIPPGDYLLGVNIMRGTRGDSPFARTFFPGTQDSMEAQTVEITLGDSIALRSLIMPPPFPTHAVEGRLVYSDSSSVKSGMLEVRSQKGYSREDKSMAFAFVKDGKFSFRALAGKGIWINPSTYDRVSWVSREPVYLLVEKDVTDLVIIIEKR